MEKGAVLLQRWRWLCALALVLTLVAAACGDDDDEDTAASGSGSEAAEETAEIPTFTITATDDLAAKKFTFDVPSDISGGVVTLELKNDGKEFHDFQLVKAVDGHTLDDLLSEVESEDAPLSDWVDPPGGASHAVPGATTRSTLELEPDATYWYFCTESSGGEEEGTEEVSHAGNGMAGEFTVEGDSGAELPDAPASVTAKDYSFEVSGLKAGKNTIAFVNDGPEQIHHALFFPVVEGKTFEDAKAALTSEEETEGPPPVDFENGVGTTVMGADHSMVVELDLKPGTYALICFMPDKGTAGPPHASKGMLTEVTIS